MRNSAKSFRKTLREAGAFYAPEALAMKMRAQLPEYIRECEAQDDLRGLTQYGNSLYE